jgi:hypothetical protein
VSSLEDDASATEFRPLRALCALCALCGFA